MNEAISSNLSFTCPYSHMLCLLVMSQETD